MVPTYFFFKLGTTLKELWTPPSDALPRDGLMVLQPATQCFLALQCLGTMKAMFGSALVAK